MHRTTKIRITELNPHVICVLCGGYYINATTIVECLHSFCRTCITRYLETSKYCPVCDVMVHKTRPLEYIRSDKTLQDLVYKLIPGLYKSEMKRRREYYSQHDPPGVTLPRSEDRGDEFHDRIIYTEDEKISLALELCAEGIPFKTPSSIHGHNGPENIKIKDVRYLHCPAAFSVGNLKKFIRMKFDLKLKYEIDIFHTAEPLPDFYTLMDIAYIYTWTRRAPVRLFYTVYERRRVPRITDVLSNLEKNTINVDNVVFFDKSEEPDAKPTAKAKKEKDKVETKKRKLPDGPADVSPDLDLEKCKHKKEVGGPRSKRAKKLLAVVDSSVMEAMSESEGQLAKLSLDCGAEEGRGKGAEKGPDGRMSQEDTEGSDSPPAESGAKEAGDGGEDKVVCQDGKHCEGGQISPGSISLSMFQPLTEVAGGQKEGPDKVYDFGASDAGGTQVQPKVKGKRGRKPKSATESKKPAVDVSSDSKETVHTESLVISTKHPGIKSPVRKETVHEKLKEEKASGKSSLCKNKNVQNKDKVGTDQPEKVKRKYVRKAVKNPSNEKNPNPKKSQNQTKGVKKVQSSTPDEQANGVTEVSKTADDSDPKDISDTANKGTSSGVSVITENSTNNQTEVAGTKVSADFQSKTPDSASVPKEIDQLTNGRVDISHEPSTPLYGKTPKVSECNEGVPVSPVPECAENGAVVNGGPVVDNGADNIGAKDKVNGNVTNGEVSRGFETVTQSPVRAGDKGNCGFELNGGSKPALVAPALRSDDAQESQGQGIKSVNGSTDSNQNTFLRAGVSVPLPYSTYSNNLLTGAPPGVNCITGTFPRLPGHVTNGLLNHVTTGYLPLDQGSDQPLDLTNNGQRLEYTKGKIFKTKMLKKTYPKTDTVHNGKDKAPLPNMNGATSGHWT